ncbi:IclR family transcriptional regulator (plasmid) [Cupriavidus basilensis]
MSAEHGGERRGVAASQTLDRAVQVLKIVTGSCTVGIGLSDLVKATGLTKPTTRRLLLALIENGLVEQHPEDRRYYAGAETYALGILAAERFGIRRLAADSLVRIAERSGDAALLSVQRGCETVCLAREEGTYPLRSHVLQPGDRHPIGVGGGGIALLAILSDDGVERALTFNAERLAADYPGLSLDLVRKQVHEARTHGYGLNPGLVVEGSYGMGVAIHDPRSGISAALTIAGVESRFTDARIQELAVFLQEEKEYLEMRMRGFDAAPKLLGKHDAGFPRHLANPS